MSKETNEGFSKESRDIVKSTQKQLDSFGGFDEQQERIRALQGRIEAGRQKIRALSDRVDVVSARIDGWERADREWQERTRKRLKIIWLITSVIIFAIILLFVTAQYAPEGLEDATIRFANDSIHKLKNTTTNIFSHHNTSWDTAEMENSTARLQSILNRTGKGIPGGDQRLRVFDEL
jgi:hypothetical protein